MKEKFQKVIEKLTDLWNKLSVKTRIIGISAISAVVIVLIVVIAVTNTTKYELLCSGLDNSEAAQIYSAVSAKNIPVKVSGDSVYVKQGTANSVLMQLAEQGLPEGKLSYDIYSSGTNYAETDKDKDIKQIQQTQDRLQDTIETIPGVKKAIVNIAKTDSNSYVLVTDKTPTTASVKLSLSSGTTLTKTQVNGIIELVAHSVSGLSTDQVTIADSDGNELNATVTGTDETADQLIMKNKYESNIKEKLLGMLDQIYGEGNANVVVNADIDYSKVSTVTNNYTSGVASIVTGSSEVSYEGSSIPEGVTGVSGTQPAYPDNEDSTTNAYNSKESTTTSYAVGSIQEAVSRVGGKLNKLTVAIVLNNNNPIAATTDAAALQTTIAAAAGTTADNVSIQQMAFSSEMPPEVVSQPKFTLPMGISVNGQVIYVIIAGLLIIIALICLLIVLLHNRKKKREMREREALEEAQALEEQEKEAEGKIAEGAKGNLPIKSIEETINEGRDNTYKKQIEDFADNKPELVAQILKNWLKD